MKIFTRYHIDLLAAQLREQWGSASVHEERINGYLSGLTVYVGPRTVPAAFAMKFSATRCESDPTQTTFASCGIEYGRGVDSLREAIEAVDCSPREAWYVATRVACVVVRAAGENDARVKGANHLININPTGTVQVVRHATLAEIDLHGVDLGPSRLEK